MRCFVLFALLLFGGGLAPPVSAADGPVNDDCLACHGEPGAVSAGGRSLTVAAEAFAASVHAGASCVDCHQDLSRQTEWPHPAKLARVSCAGCHEGAVAKYEAGIHAVTRHDRPGSLAATCVDCHGTHDIRPSTDRASRTHHLNLSGTCGRCHGNAEVIRREQIRSGNVLADYRDSIHGRAVAKSGLMVAPTCSDCHAAHDVTRLTSAASPVHRSNVAATCGKCHDGIRGQYDASIHGQRVATGAAAAPTCVDCHSAHRIARTDTAGFGLGVVDECGTCHVRQARTFRDTFHGKVTTLGFQRVAKCADCHSAHAIQGKDHPASPVAPANLMSTCGRCHGGAGVNFVKYDPHPDPTDYGRSPVLWWVNRFYTYLIGGMFAFFGAHSLAWAARASVERRRRAGDQPGATPGAHP